MDELHDFPTMGINSWMSEYIKSLPDLSGKIVVDIPCGDGRASYEFQKKGATIKALDLFPDFLKLKNIKAEYADLSDIIPVENDSADYIVCQEGIEHIPNQVRVLQEFNRILKKGGILLLTTPNNSNLRARLSFFLLESDYWKRIASTELDSIWFSRHETDKIYFGHLFLLGVNFLQSLATVSGFRVIDRRKTNIEKSSLVLAFLYPIIVLVTFLSFFHYKKKNKNVDETKRKNILFERVKLNISLKTLFCKHMFWIMKKECNLEETIKYLKDMTRSDEL